jgi:hypothetical protein
MPVLIGSAMIAAAILLSTLVTAVGTRFVGLEGLTDENMWLIDRLTGNVYKCQAPERGKASCEAEIATGSIAERRARIEPLGAQPDAPGRGLGQGNGLIGTGHRPAM